MSSRDVSRSSAFSSSIRYGWSEQVAAKLHHDVARGLDVHRPSDHRHQPLAQRHQVRRDIRIVVAQRTRVHAGHEEAGRVEEQRALAPTSVRSRSLVPGPSRRTGASSFQRWPVTALPRSTTVVPGGTTSSDLRPELVEAIGVAAERKTDDVLTLLRLGQIALHDLIGYGILHVSVRSKPRAAEPRPPATARPFLPHRMVRLPPDTNVSQSRHRTHRRRHS